VQDYHHKYPRYEMPRRDSLRLRVTGCAGERDTHTNPGGTNHDHSHCGDQQGRLIMGDRHNPKTEAPANVEKDPEDWISGDDPMTPAQASYLKTLAEQADDPDAYADGLSKAEASKRIDALREKLGL
jgi:hypothetical protein